MGGGVKVLYEYANHLADHGHQVELAYMANELWRRFGLPESLRKILARFSIFWRPRWFKLDKRICKYPLFQVRDDTVHDADVIVATEARTAEPVSGLNQSKGRKFYFIQDFENWVLSDKDVCDTYALGLQNLTVSRWLSDLADKYSEKPSICIPNGIDTSMFCVKNPIEDRRPHTLIWHYRSAEHKGPGHAMAVIRALEKKYADVSVIVVGIEDKPAELPESCSYYQNVSQDKVAELNNQAAVFMCTSVKEGFGLPGLEAMACGCALVSTDYPAVCEYAKDKENALISPVGDVEKMLRNIERLFDDADYRIAIAENGAREASKRCIDDCAKRFEAVLQDEL